jgi:hypothetical protein
VETCARRSGRVINDKGPTINRRWKNRYGELQFEHDQDYQCSYLCTKTYS